MGTEDRFIRYPFTMRDGTPVWACCLTSIGKCEHGRTPGPREHTVKLARAFLACLVETHTATSVRDMMRANRRAGHYWFETSGETRTMVAPGVIMAKRREQFSSHAADWYVFTAFGPDGTNRAYATVTVYGDGTPEGDVQAADRARTVAGVIRAAHGDPNAPNRVGLVDQLTRALTDPWELVAT